MNKKEIEFFIGEMNSIGDNWTVAQVKEVYGNFTLADALADRKTSINYLFDILGQVINRD